MNQWQETVRKYAVPIGLLLALLTGAIFWFGFVEKKEAPGKEAPFLLTSQVSQETRETTTESAYFVDIKGAVVTPGVYQVPPGSRVQDIVGLAGGLREDAATAYVNLAAKVEDQQLIYVMTEVEATQSDTPLPATVPATGNTPDQSEAKVNINTADASLLQTLSGIGIKKAEAIIAYREEHGPFASVDDLQEVSGIGEKTVEKLRASITI